MTDREKGAFFTLLVAVSVCCAGCPKPTTSPVSTQDSGVHTGAGAWGEDDLTDPPPTDAGGTGGTDGMYQGPPVLMRNGRPIGFLRFVHVAPGMGRVRFIADSMPLYESDHVEAVVEEGSTSGYLQAINVTHRVRIVREQLDGDAGVTADLVAPITTDVYNNAGCTVALAGNVNWRRGARTQDPQVRRLVRIVDIPRRQQGIGMMRFMVGLAGLSALDVRENDEVLYEQLPFLMITGMRRIAPGPHELRFATADAGVQRALSMTLPPGEVHTLWVFADTHQAPGTVRSLLTNDIPAGRIGPDFVGEMPVYR